MGAPSRTSTREMGRDSWVPGKCARAIFYTLVLLMTMCLLIDILWQVEVLRGKHIVDETGAPYTIGKGQQPRYGIAFADITIGAPLLVSTIALWLSGNHQSRAHYTFSLMSFWIIYTKVVGSINSLKYESPQIDFMWFMTYPFGIVIAGLYLIWVQCYFDQIFAGGTIRYTKLNEMQDDADTVESDDECAA